MTSRWRRYAVAVVWCLAAAGCTTETTFHDQTPTRVDVAVGNVAFSLEVPASLGTGRLNRDIGGDDCPHQEHIWRRLPSGSDDQEKLLFAGSATRGCPDQRALNGRFPTWATVSDLPGDAERVQAPVGTAYRFAVAYQQCTNECYSADYQVYFIDVSGGAQPRSFWIQAAHIDPKTLGRIVASIRLE